MEHILFECEKCEDERKELVRKQKSIKSRNSETKGRIKGVSNVILVFKRDKNTEQDIGLSFFVDCVVTHSTSVGGGNALNRRLSTQKRRRRKRRTSLKIVGFI